MKWILFPGDKSMADNTPQNLIAKLIDLLVYKPPSTPKPFVLEEAKSQKPEQLEMISDSTADLNALLRYAHRVEAAIEQSQTILSSNPTTEEIKKLVKEIQSLEAQKKELSPVTLSYESSEEIAKKNISSSLQENLLIINKIYQLPQNRDLIIREIIIPAKPPLKAALVFSKGLIDKKDINSTVMTPLLNAKSLDTLKGDILQILAAQILPINHTTQATAFPAVIKAISEGDTAIFVDGSAGAILVETKGFEHRAIGSPRIEQTIRGNQSAFTETLLANIAQVRLALRAPDLIADIIILGARSQTECAVMFLQSVANPSLVAEVKRRITGITTDYIPAGSLQQYIEDHPQIPMPQVLATERPDRIAAHLSEGRIAVLVEGDPFALIVPISIFSLFHSPEDFALKTPVSLLIRMLRIAGSVIAMIVPAAYIAISYYHQEALPTELLLAIAGARERIPFPAIIEVLFMELSFELIREAGTRKPGLLGETLGIVGAIILGQAVVTANLISPVTVVVVAISALASFSIPDYATGMAIRLGRFLFLSLAIITGLVGIATGLFILTILLCSMKSFGIPYLSPLTPKTAVGMDAVLGGPIYNLDNRPDEINPLDRQRQPHASRKWLKKSGEGENASDEL